MNPLPSSLLVREALFERDLPQVLEAPDQSLRQRIYRLAMTLVPANPTAFRSTGDSPNPSDEVLFNAYRRGDADALDKLLKRYLPKLQAFARKHLPPHDAADAVQEAFAEFITKAPSFQFHTSLRSYLFWFLRFTVLRAKRALWGRGNQPLDAEILETNPGVIDEDFEIMLINRISSEELIEVLHSECDLLEQDVILFTREGLDGAAIAAALDITANYVRVIRSRAIAKLRKVLTPASV